MDEMIERVARAMADSFKARISTAAMIDEALTPPVKE